MMPEVLRHAVSRLWLYAFAGIVAVLCAVPNARASGLAVVTNCNVSGTFSQSMNGRTPLRAFATDLGVYELDTALKGVRIWQRTEGGIELRRPKGTDVFRPFTQTQIEAASRNEKPDCFTGIVTKNGTKPTDDSAGIAFKQPVGFDKHPTENKFAVLSGGNYINLGLNQYCPSIQVYGFEETAGDDGSLSNVVLSFEGAFENAFYEVTNGWHQEIDRIWKYPDVLVTTNYYSDGSIAFVTTNHFVNYTTNVIDRSFSTNWVYVVSTNQPPVTQTNNYSRTGLDEPVWWDARNTALFVPGFEYTVVLTNEYFTVTTNYYSQTNFVFKPIGITTNSSYLSGATDVAFLGDAGLVASIVMEDYQAERSAFLVFGTDPAAPAKLFPVEGLDRAIRGIAVDKKTGDIYAAVPDMSAVFRYSSPEGTPLSWVTKPDRTPVVRDADFVAGVTNAPGSLLGRLSHPADVAVWYPDDAAPILLVADTENRRVQAFDPNSLSWAATNWLGTNIPRVPSSSNGLVPVLAEELGMLVKIDPETGLPFDPDILFFVETNETSVVTNYYHVPAYIPYVSVTGNGIVTNYYRLETTAFPLFATEVHPGGSNDDPNNPKGVWGQDGTTSFVLADTGAHRVRVFNIADLSALDSDEIFSLDVWWPSVGGAAPGLSARDMAVTNGASGSAVVYWDAAVPGVSPTKVHVVREHETYENALHFTVAPARHDRTYTLSVESGEGIVDPVQATATVPAGSTEGVFTFVARDGIVSTESFVSWRDQYGNWVPEGDSKAVSAVTNTVSVSPVYTFTISSDGGFSTNALLAVANVDPVITNAQVIGYVVQGLDPYVQALGLRVEASDASGTDDSDLTYLWWASTNVNWAINHRDWAVANNDWAASASAEWSDGPFFPAAQSTTASVITGTETSGTVTNTVSLLVAKAKEVRLPPYTIGRSKIDEDGYPIASEPGSTPFYVVCTVLDKDGGYAIVSFPTPSEPSGSAGLWTGVYNRGVTPGDSDVTPPSYRARFIAISGTNVTFVVWKEGESGSGGTVTLQSSTTLDGATEYNSPNWTTFKRFQISEMSLPSTNNVTPAGAGEVRFFRVVQP